MGLTSRGNDLEGLVVLVAADFTPTHHGFSSTIAISFGTNPYKPAIRWRLDTHSPFIDGYFLGNGFPRPSFVMQFAEQVLNYCHTPHYFASRSPQQFENYHIGRADQPNSTAGHASIVLHSA
jgi:hypothetical protein